MSNRKSILDNLKESKSKSVVAFTEFTRMRDKYRTHLFCCVEGEDSKYYSIRVDLITKYNTKNIFLICGNKKEVLRFYNLINHQSDYAKVRFAFFIDKDFDDSVKSSYNNVYETPVYSIENFYTSEDAFIKILRNEFQINEGNVNYQECLRLFRERQKEFHEKVQLLNYWIICHRIVESTDGSDKLNLNSFNLNKLITAYNIDSLTSISYDFRTLNSLFKNARNVSKKEIKNVEKTYSSNVPQKFFRGKFEIIFLFNFLNRLKEEFKKSPNRFTTTKHIKLNLSLKNILSELSQYADTPSCLQEYLSNYS